MSNSPLSLHDAAITDNIYEIIEQIDSGVDIESRNKTGDTALHSACALGNIKSAKTLLLLGANPNQYSSSDSTPLVTISSLRNAIPFAVMLLKHKASIDLCDKIFGRTPLIAAVQNKNTKLVKFYIKSGANIEAKDVSGHTALHYASTQDKTFKIAHILLKCGASTTVADIHGATPYDLARKNGVKRIMQLLSYYNNQN
jgi:serine/threonine-protein phosphatase 6 regulatory ankyrin repeat subunit A/serine/threonine-protein phosphatase 6 regulatory ankyrin repeat subunit B